MKLIKSESTFAYPLLISDGMNVKKKLADKLVYVSTLCPNVIKECAVGTVEYEYVANFLSIQIDQRYSLEDMEAMCEIIEGKIRIEDCF